MRLISYLFIPNKPKFKFSNFILDLKMQLFVRGNEVKSVDVDQTQSISEVKVYNTFSYSKLMSL